jgi:hypothetical protein
MKREYVFRIRLSADELAVLDAIVAAKIANTRASANRWLLNEWKVANPIKGES